MSLEMQRFQRRSRLRHPREFQRVKSCGKRAEQGCFVVLAALRSAGGTPCGPRLGIAASRRVGGAVARARVKRRIREWFRRTRGVLHPEVDILVIVRSGAPALGAEEISARLESLVTSVGAMR